VKGTAEGIKARFDMLIGNEVVQRLIEFHKQVQEQVGALKDQADGLGLSTDSLQAYIAAFARPATPTRRRAARSTSSTRRSAKPRSATRPPSTSSTSSASN